MGWRFPLMTQALWLALAKRIREQGRAREQNGKRRVDEVSLKSLCVIGSVVTVGNPVFCAHRKQGGKCLRD